MSKFYILIPPSEGKSAGGSGAPLKSVGKNVAALAKQLAKPGTDWDKILGVKNRALEKAIGANRDLLKSPTMRAMERYTGVVYQAIDYPTLDKKAQTFFNAHVRIVSALFGLVEPRQLIPDYKLKIDKLGAANHWRPILKDALKNAFIIDLLPQAHQKAVDYTDGMVINFLRMKNGKRISAGHHGKQIKGRFIRWLCDHQTRDVKQ